MERLEALEAIGAARLLPVIRVPTADQAVASAMRLVELDLAVIELTATIDDWPEATRVVRASAPGVVLGVGTIATHEQAELALAQGADFLVSAWPAPAVREVADAGGVAFLEGGLTPGELAAASARGAAKLFPAHLGGPGYLRSVLAVLPAARIVPTGGIRLSDVPAYLEAGAFAVGVGTGLLAGDDVEARVRDVLDRVGAAS